MAFIRRVCDCALNASSTVIDKVMIAHRRKTEIRKFKDKRRVSITESVELTPNQKKAIDAFYKENYGATIPYTWHRHYTAFTGRFDVKYFPELLYIPEFEHFINLWSEYNAVFSDKNVLPIVANQVGVKTPRALFSCVRGACKDEEGRIISLSDMIDALKNTGEVFLKSTVDSSSGRGCHLACFEDGIDTLSQKPIRELLSELGQDFAIQERLTCHESIRNLYPNSVNTFRIMTYRWHDDIIVAPATMRIGSGGSYLDNIHSGGMCIAIGKDGALHDTAFTEFNQKFQQHPDTSVKFDNYVIVNFPEVINAAVRLHEALPQLGVVHWDFTIDQYGESVLIEANTRGTSIQLIQRPWGCGAFGEKTAEILQWMKVMKRTEPHKRINYAFGKTE